MDNLFLNKTDEYIHSQILQTIKSMKFGSIEIVIHDSKIVQINKIEKMRFDKENVMARR